MTIEPIGVQIIKYALWNSVVSYTTGLVLTTFSLPIIGPYTTYARCIWIILCTAQFFSLMLTSIELFFWTLRGRNMTNHHTNPAPVEGVPIVAAVVVTIGVESQQLFYSI